MNTPRITYPSTGGITNPHWKPSADIRSSFARVRASQVNGIEVRGPMKLCLIMGKVVEVPR